MPEQTSELQGVIDAINYATSQIGNAIGAYGDALKAEIEAENIATGAGLSTAAAADAIVAGKLLGTQSALIDGSISLTKSGAALIAGDKLGVTVTVHQITIARFMMHSRHSNTPRNCPLRVESRCPTYLGFDRLWG